MKNKSYAQDVIVNHMKNYGFVFANSEIYNGLANAWDYGPLGVNLKNNLKKLWWTEFVTKDHTVVGLDSSILMNPLIWKASGHLANFSDPLIDCKKCQTRYRADKLIEEHEGVTEIISEATSNEEIKAVLEKYNIVCPNCHAFDWTDVRHFNLMFKTFQGVLEDASSTLYLRPETAQGIFVNFKNVQRSMRMKVPFGIGQIGKSFRNEITPGNFIFRTREFEQMELEYFTREDLAYEDFDRFLNKINKFLTEQCGLNPNSLKQKEHAKEELSHYSKKTVDYVYDFPHGFSELWGLAYRTDYDLKTHMESSKKDLTYLDPTTNEKFIPHVVEPSVGVERLLYAICCNAYDEEQLAEDDTRVVMHLPYKLAPYKVAVLPLVNKLKDAANDVFMKLIDLGIECTFDVSGSIGKRYRRQDAIGTPFCLTVDFDTVEKNTVTIRNRDTMEQVTISVDEIPSFFMNQK
ncbi:glycine--tRNA ligase [Ureaplasma ceti]|uniref:glycine--tRNA ligase n=1 Tax=Ureaplasma ceti TaxID=3119530 RepID=UPI003B20D47E